MNPFLYSFVLAACLKTLLVLYVWKFFYAGVVFDFFYRHFITSSIPLLYMSLDLHQSMFFFVIVMIIHLFLVTDPLLPYRDVINFYIFICSLRISCSVF